MNNTHTQLEDQLAEKRIQKLREVGQRMYESYHTWTCMVCAAEVDYEEQIKGAVYAHPCGHYLWDGQARGSRPTSNKPN